MAGRPQLERHLARQSSSNAGRAAEILILLGQADRKGMALAALAAATGEAKSSVHRTLVALAEYGLVVQNGNRGNYMLGPATYALAHRSLGVNEIVAKPFSPKVLWSRLDEVINRPRPYIQVKGLLRPVPRSTDALLQKTAA